jgi:diadenosine tetraphosphate (Ap4A) HIT family hydrolase
LPDLNCAVCRGASADEELQRVQVWENSLWRLTMGLSAEVPGFSYLEPKRHIASIAELDGAEARSFGEILSFVTSHLRSEVHADVVYVYIFGDGVPHFHVHLAPHRAGDALSDQMIRGELSEEKLPNGFTNFVSAQFPPLPRDELLDVANRVRLRLSEAMI